MSHVSQSKIEQLEQISKEMRIDSLSMIHRRQAGHPGGSLSAAEILATLYFYKLRIDPNLPDWPDRDRFILSKGHASAMLYSALARRGYFPLEDLDAWGNLDCHLQAHPDRLKTKGVDMTSGILGHGVAVGAGLALAAKMSGKSYRVYVLLGDGECQAGIVWEGAMTAAKYKLANLIVIVDYNDVQLDGPVHTIMPIEPFYKKWIAHNWAVQEVNGHDISELMEVLDLADEIHDRPIVIIAHTTKGKGVSFMENQSRWHGVAPDDAQFKAALLELNGGKHV